MVPNFDNWLGAGIPKTPYPEGMPGEVWVPEEKGTVASDNDGAAKVLCEAYSSCLCHAAIRKNRIWLRQDDICNIEVGGRAFGSRLDF